MRRSRDRPATGRAERHSTVPVAVDTEAVEAAGRRLGWRVSGTHPPPDPRPLEPAILASRSADIVARGLGRRQGRPRSLPPRSGPRDDDATGLMRWLPRGGRGLTRWECVVRRRLTAEKATLAGRSAGQPTRATARPTAARLLEVFREITLPLRQEPHQSRRPLTPLSARHQRLLVLLDFPLDIYTRLCPETVKPP